MRARRARVDDVDAICRVCADVVRDTYPGLWSDAEIERAIAHYYDPSGCAASARGFVERGTRPAPEVFHGADNLLFWRRVGPAVTGD
jgi:hypothetical protein